jgi:arylsulfatase A
VPLWRNGEIIERPVDQTTITRRYTEEATRFIEENRDHPFFLYLPHTMPHVPLFRSKTFEGRSRRGLYGDAVEEVDWSVGRILARLHELDLEERTLVVFTSDNGPWLAYDTLGGSAGLLHQGKGTTWEGGMRVPAIFWWPGRIAPGTIRDPGTTMDLFTTATKIAGGEVPADRPIDGLDLTPALFGTGPSPRDTVYYYRYDELYALRKGSFKAHFITQGEYGIGPPDKTRHDPPLLYQLDEDPGERFDVAARYPEIVADLVEEAKRHRAEVKVAPAIFDLRPE